MSFLENFSLLDLEYAFTVLCIGAIVVLLATLCCDINSSRHRRKRRLRDTDWDRLQNL